MFTHHDSLPTTTLSNRQETLTQSGKEVQQELSPKSKRVLIVDDDPDITLTFKKGLEAENEKSSNLFFEVSTYNDPINALSEFKPNLYDLLLVDINMPKMDGLEFSAKILEQDINVRVCFITATEINTRALREQYSSLSIGCFIKKPVTIENLVERVKAELN
ncbi:MAG: response regulator [Nitrososphaeraceae archaeon]